jgi:hypothetical protein
MPESYFSESTKMDIFITTVLLLNSSKTSNWSEEMRQPLRVQVTK